MLQITSDAASITRLTTNVPRELRERPQWVLWRGEDRPNQRTGAVKVSKIPIDPHTLTNASTIDPQTWGTFEDGCKALPCALEEWGVESPEKGGLGVVLAATDHYAGIDLDHCRHPETGTLEPWAKQIITVLNSYAEVSPSGTGVHIYVQGRLSGKGQKRGPIELYDRERYLTVTGNHLPGTPATIEARQDVIEGLYVAMPMMAKLLADSGRREKFQQLFTGDTSGYGNDESRVDLALCNMLVAGGAQTLAECMAVIRLSGLYDAKWDREDYQERTIGKALEAKGSTPKAPPQTQTGGRVQVVSARELADKVLPPVRCVVRGLVPEGFTLLAGDPKAGKSWAVLNMALAVAAGERAFEYFDTEPGDVLYFALEDSEQRLQERVDALLKGWVAPDNLRLVCQVPGGQAFEQTLADALADHPATRLVIVDVLARVQRRGRGNRNAYLEDYEAVSPLQRFALDHRIGIVGVTHTNKREVTTDKFHRITGTTGIIGCADTMLLLHRDRSEASGVLSVTGRDVADAVYKAEFHDGVWVVQGEQMPPQPGPEPAARVEAQALLRSLLAAAPRLASEVQKAATAAGISETTLRRAQRDLGIKPKKPGKEWYWSLPAVHSGEEERNKPAA